MKVIVVSSDDGVGEMARTFALARGGDLIVYDSAGIALAKIVDAGSVDAIIIDADTHPAPRIEDHPKPCHVTTLLVQKLVGQGKGDLLLAIGRSEAGRMKLMSLGCKRHAIDKGAGLLDTLSQVLGEAGA